MATSSDLSERFEVSEQTIRNWSNEFASFLSPDATPPGERAPRYFTPEDERILSTVATLRQQRKSYAEIAELLEEGHRVEEREAPPSGTNAELTRWQMQEVIGQQREQLATLQGRYEEAQEQAQKHITDLEEKLERERAAHLEAEKRAVRAETLLEHYEQQDKKTASLSNESNNQAVKVEKKQYPWWQWWK